MVIEREMGVNRSGSGPATGAHAERGRADMSESHAMIDSTMSITDGALEPQGYLGLFAYLLLLPKQRNWALSC